MKAWRCGLSRITEFTVSPAIQNRPLSPRLQKNEYSRHYWRPGLRKAIRRLRPGDSLVVWKLDRLGRSVRDLITLVSELQERGIHFRSLTDSIDTSTPAGRFFFHVMSALAEMERELIVERTRAGLAAAREQGRIGGRRRIMTTEVVERCRRMLENGATRQQVADVIGVGVKTIYKYFPIG
ncbi:unnamed protein product [Klebsiella pneumoniae subsp. rhinoscleromatis SB3432]|nr:unnamed protein product [Klebsiella pneumoniae subsp. rhinoscleromatis SB3432]